MHRAIERVASECRFVANTFREACVHPRSTSVIDKRSGKLISRHGHRVHQGTDGKRPHHG